MEYKILAILPILSLFLVAPSQAQQGVGSGGLGKYPIATITAPGAVQPDGSTITITSKGVITSTGGSGGTPANPTASIGAAAVNGSATTYMRSDAAPKIGTNAVTNALIAQMPQHTFKGNNTGSTATPLDLTIAQLNTELVGNAFFNVTGPSASIKTFTFPNASATVLTTNAAVTVGQGGTGIASGTSGGILAYTASGTLASSGALTANLPVIGGGAGVAPSVGTRSGNTTAFVTTTGSQTSGDCVKIDASGNHVANGSACGSGGAVSVTADTANIVVTPSPGTGTFTIGTTEAGRDASGGGVAIVTADNTKTVQLGAFTYTLAQAGTAGFASGWGTCLLNVGATAATVTSTTSVFKGAGGATSLFIPSGSFACPASDGTDYVTTAGIGLPRLANLQVTALTYVIDGGGSAITTGVKGDLLIPFACTINSATLQADQSGSIVVDVWKKAYATSSPPTVGETITASALPTLVSAQSSQDATLTGWTTSVSANDMFRFNVNSATTVTRATLTLKCTKT